jgi:hypothetical protein
MVNQILPYNRNPFVKSDGTTKDVPKLTSSIGYLYGICARLLWYVIENNQVQYTQSTINGFAYGTAKHREIQQSKFPEMLHEHHVSRMIPEIYGIQEIGATYDCYDDGTLQIKSEPRIIEIKPKYSRNAYYQTLIERFVSPSIPIFMYSYVQDKLFPLKADYAMSIIYVGHMITALRSKPPRFPYADPKKQPCSTCLYKQKCYNESPEYKNHGENKDEWAKWKMFTNVPVKTLQDFTKDDVHI